MSKIPIKVNGLEIYGKVPAAGCEYRFTVQVNGEKATIKNFTVIKLKTKRIK